MSRDGGVGNGANGALKHCIQRACMRKSQTKKNVHSNVLATFNQYDIKCFQVGDPLQEFRRISAPKFQLSIMRLKLGDDRRLPGKEF